MLGGLSVGFEGSFRGVYFCTLHFAARVRRRSCGVNSWGLSQKGQREGGMVRLNLPTNLFGVMQREREIGRAQQLVFEGF